MPNKGKKSRAKSTAEISRSFAKKDSNVTAQSFQTNANKIEGDDSDNKTKASNSQIGISNNPVIAPIYPNLKSELVRIFTITGIIIAILIGLSFVL